MGPCCVEGCDVSTEDTYYFEFPTSRLLRRRWLEVIPIPGKLPIGTVVCSRHFSADDYENVRGKVRLKRKVVPSLLLDQMSISPKDTCKSPIPPKSPTPPKSQKSSKSPVSPPKPVDTCDSTTVSVPSPVDAEKMIDDVQKSIVLSKKVVRNNIQNGMSGDSDKISKKILPPTIDHKEDIEDMITNYQIKNKVPNPALLADLLPAPSDVVPESAPAQDDEPIEIEDVKESEPVFIEISVDAADAGAAGADNDCLMLLESVQVDVDPATLLHDDYYPEQDHDHEVHKKIDPISLLTSSDEDDVILEEPHIDTVEVPDETDEDDMPLVKLVKKKPVKKKIQKKSTKTSKSTIEKMMWKGSYDYYCVHCHFVTGSRHEYNKHIAEHSTVVQVCQICGYTSSSKNMFARHGRIHKVEKKFKCHICDYRARHKMSLIFHLKTHGSESVKIDLDDSDEQFKCKKCDFKSASEAAVIKHMNRCSDDKKHVCELCEYATKKSSDLRRHIMRRHLTPKCAKK